MGPRLNYRGLVIAVLGFVLTRFTVSLALYEDPVRFYVAGILPLLLGLGLAAFGVALVVADVDEALVRETVRWCLAGTGAMLVLVVLTLLGSSAGMSASMSSLPSELFLSNFLIGGSIGGTLTGLYAARTRRQRIELQQQSNRLEVLNRLLRHEVLNAVTIIQGYASVDPDENPDAADIIRERSRSIADTIDGVRFLAQSTTEGNRSPGTIDLETCIAESAATIESRYPDASVSVDVPTDLPAVVANDRVEQVFDNLLENGVVHADATTPTISVTAATTPTHVQVYVRDEGPGLPDAQQALLESGDITEFDEPSDGYGLNIVRLLVEHFGGAIDTDVDSSGTTVTVSLRRADTRERAISASPDGLTGVRLDIPHLVVTLGAAVVAGVAYGLVSMGMGGSVAAIGVFYGISNPIVGWITHEFHSAVFGFMFAGMVAFLPHRHRNHLPAYVAVGTGWGVALWLGAAGLIAPVWLRLLGIPASIPNISVPLLVSHVIWGIALGGLTALGYRYVSPRLGAFKTRLESRGPRRSDE